MRAKASTSFELTDAEKEAVALGATLRIKDLAERLGLSNQKAQGLLAVGRAKLAGTWRKKTRELDARRRRITAARGGRHDRTARLDEGAARCGDCHLLLWTSGGVPTCRDDGKPGPCMAKDGARNPGLAAFVLAVRGGDVAQGARTF